MRNKRNFSRANNKNNVGSAPRRNKRSRDAADIENEYEPSKKIQKTKIQKTDAMELRIQLRETLKKQLDQ